jgi:hypothetical protein
MVRQVPESGQFYTCSWNLGSGQVPEKFRWL